MPSQPGVSFLPVDMQWKGVQMDMAGGRSYRAWFEWIRQCSRDAEHARLHLMELESAEGPHAQGYEPMGHGGTHDAMAATDRRMEYEDRLGRTEGTWYRAFDRAQEILYGPDGVAEELGPAKAQAVDLYYVSGLSWSDVAARLGYTARWCQMMAGSVFSWLDSRHKRLRTPS